MLVRCITNNPMVIAMNLPFIEPFTGNNLELFEAVRIEVLKGYKLLTHPLTGSIGPDINPYKSVILSSKRQTTDKESLEIIEKTIIYTADLMSNHPKPQWDDKSLEDFQLIDLDFIKNFVSA
ncbi:GrdX family protein [Zhaonella formicivorans]|uniref:GrdX family protein n=1 Tax=Zhaonella formicivorans TaxID=2528593 RepID=UPI0010D2E9EC|nr:GrdX family protein [Zhaonella formicivorans]